MRSTPPSLLALVTGSLLLASCRDGGDHTSDAAWWRLETERLRLASEVELGQIRLAKIQAKTSNIAPLQEELSALQDQRRALQSAAEAMQSDLHSADEELRLVREEALRERRVAALGLRMETLKSTNGRQYQEVEVTDVTEAGLVIKHSTGIARLVAEDLNADQRVRFGICADGSRAALQQEVADAILYNQHVDQWEQDTRKSDDSQWMRETKKIASRSISSSSNRSSSYRRPSVLTPDNGNPLHKPARRVGSGSSRYRVGTTYYYGSSPRTGYYYNSPAAKRAAAARDAPYHGAVRRATPRTYAPVRPCPSN